MNRTDIETWAGQMIVAGITHDRVDEGIVRLIERYHIGGVILFHRNCPDSETTRFLVSALQRRSETPLFVMIDQEGGKVVRIKESLFRLPSAEEMGAWKLERIEDEAHHLAMRLKELGVNINLAPVLDVDSNPENPVIGSRAFSKTPQAAFDGAYAFYKGMQSVGLLGVGKHFPGHGDTKLDSHEDLPYVRHDLKRLYEIELEPFRLAIEAGFPILMAAHVVYDAIDPDFPATMSKLALSGLLREKMGFEGLILSDDIEMKAVMGRYETEEIVYRMVNAGIDVFLVCHTYALAEKVHRTLVRLVDSGRIEAERLKQSYDRIMHIKHNQPIFDTDYS